LVTFDGMGLSAMLDAEEPCFTQVEKLVWYAYYACYGVSVSPIEWYEAGVSATNFFGTLSPVARKCYHFSKENDEKWRLLFNRIFKWENLYYALKNNLLQSYSEIDHFSWGFFVNFKHGRYIEGMSDYGKLVNRFII